MNLAGVKVFSWFRGIGCWVHGFENERCNMFGKDFFSELGDPEVVLC